MNVLVITSCTGEKLLKFAEQPVLEDFQLGEEHIAQLEKRWDSFLCPAEELYTGGQHQRLMQAVNYVRSRGNLNIDLHILSAGYGLIPANRKVLPYEVTFNTLNARDLQGNCSANATAI